jgi:hypothetical protein
MYWFLAAKFVKTPKFFYREKGFFWTKKYTINPIAESPNPQREKSAKKRH